MSPTTLIQQLRQVLATEQICDGSRLVEDDCQSSSGRTCITGLGKGLIVRPTLPAYAATRFGPASPNQALFPFFKSGTPKITKLCDYILFCPRKSGSQLVVLLCELKSGNTGRAGQQIHGGMLVAEYIINVTLLHQRPTQVPEIEYRGLLLSNKGVVQKQSTRPGKGYDYFPAPRTKLPTAHLRAGSTYCANALCAEIKCTERAHISDPIRG